MTRRRRNKNGTSASLFAASLSTAGRPLADMSVPAVYKDRHGEPRCGACGWRHCPTVYALSIWSACPVTGKAAP